MLKRSCTPMPKIEEDCYDWYERHEDRCRLAEASNHDLVLIGDSITHFWETHLAPELYRETFSRYSTLNLGFGWDRTSNVLWRLDHGEMKGQTPKLVVMHIGTNNLSGTERYPGGDSPEDVADGIVAITEKIHELSPKTEILIMSIFQRGLNTEGAREKIRQANNFIEKKLSGIPYIHLLNISEKFMLPDGSELNSSLFNDNCHPNPAGYKIWAETLTPWLEKYLGK